MIVRVFSFSTLPVPLHFLQAAEGFLPVPWHVGQVVTEVKEPKIVRVEFCTLPDPWHVGQTVSFAFLSKPVPLHSSQGSRCLILISFSRPKQASRKSISISSLKSSPRCALFELEPYPSEYPSCLRRQSEAAAPIPGCTDAVPR